MSARDTRMLTWAVIVVGMCGCADVAKRGWHFGARDVPSQLPPPPAEPTTRPAAARGGLRTTQATAEELERAIQLVLDLRYEEGAQALMDVLPRLEAAQDLPRQGEATFWLGYCREKQGRRDRAIELYQKVLQDFADTPAAKQARQRLQDLTIAD